MSRAPWPPPAEAATLRAVIAAESPVATPAEAPPVKHARRRLAWAEPLLVCVAAPTLIFPRGPLPLAGLLAILALWLARLVRRERARATALDVPMLLLLVMAAQSVYPSVDRSLSMPKLYGIVLGVAVYFGVVRAVAGRRAWWVVVGALAAAMVAVAAVGLVSTSWIIFKLPGGAAIYSRIPHLISSVQSSQGPISGIQPNELGGTLAFLLPIPLALLLWGIRRSHQFALVATAVALLSGGVVLVLTQSRSGLLGFALAAALLVAMRWRVAQYTAVAGALTGGVAGVLNQGAFLALLHHMDYVGNASVQFAGRQEIWSRAWYMIQDFPFTGIGLNTFPVVLDTLYPSFLAGPDARIPHAHDIYLQTAVDLGLAGLMAFVGLWLIVFWQAIQAYRKADDPMTRGAIAGLAAGCVAYLAFGLTDAITLGAKPLFLLWIMVGLIISANRLLDGERKEGAEGKEPDPTQNPSVPSPQSSVLFRPGPLALALASTVWQLYWAMAILFAVLAYVVDAIAITGWVP